MVSSILLGTVLLAAGPVRETLAPPDLAAYEAAKAKVGRDADAQVKLALWCEAHGLQAERVKHLALAVLNDPSNALARGLMGLVAYRGRWQRPEAIGEKARADALLAEYRDRRDRTPDTADAQWDLALWCEQKGLKAEADAHVTAVLRLDPGREAAWKRLGYRKHNGRWMTETQLAAEKAEADAQKQADRHWKPLLEKWRERLEGKSETRRLEADAALSEITDPRAVPMIWAVFASGRPERQAVAVRVLGQIDAAGASRALAMLAVFGKSAEVRRIATETLKRRDSREFAGLLIGLMRDPIKYKTQAVGGPGKPGALLVEGQRKNLRREYVPPPPPRLNFFNPFTDLVTYDANGLPAIVRRSGVGGYIGPDGYAIFSGGSGVGNGPYGSFAFGRGAQLPTQPQVGQNLAAALAQNPTPAHLASALSAAHQTQGTSGQLPGAPAMANPGMVAATLMQRGFQSGNPGVGNTILIGQAALQTQQAAVAMQQQLESDVASIERYNTDVRDLNGRVTQVLNDATTQDLPSDRGVWEPWWSDQLGYAQKAAYGEEKPTVVQVVTPQLPQVAGFDTNQGGYVRRVSCFGAGTPVHTLDGVRPIESLKVGDQVLTQNLRSGALGYKPILVVHHNPPSKTFRINLDDETIVSSQFHRFWKVGKGWVMARDLKAGDTVRNLGGVVQVAAIDDGAVQPVFNLDVADDADFFVGRQGALVHDNTLPDLRQAPFDAPPALAATR